jgi:recombination protein RecA
MSDVFEAIKKKLESSSKGERIMILSESEIAGEVVYMDTPTYDLNRILSGSIYKGVPSRTHTLLVGPEASGKSSFMCLTLAAAQRQGYIPFIIDAEGAWTAEFCERWGIDPTKAFIVNTPWIEEIMVELAKVIDEGWEKLAITMDSIGAVESRKMVTDGVDGDVKADQGGLQKKIKRMMKMIVDITKRQNSISLSAGHYYGNPTGYGDPEKIGGGFYPKLAADIIVTLKKSPIYENPNAKAAARGKVLGTEIHAATIKNRYAPPFQEATIELNYKNGVNQLAGLIPVCIELGMIEKSGAWYSVPSLEIKVQGEAKLYTALGEHDLQPLLDDLDNRLKTEGYSTVNEDIEEILGSEPVDE